MSQISTEMLGLKESIKSALEDCINRQEQLPHVGLVIIGEVKAYEYFLEKHQPVANE